MPQLFFDGVERIFDSVCQHLAVFTRNGMLVVTLREDGAATGALPKDDGVDMSRRFVSHHLGFDRQSVQTIVQSFTTLGVSIFVS